MYDTINLTLPINGIEYYDYSKKMQHLNNYTEHITNNGQIYFSAYIKNLKLYLSNQKLNLSGSLAKYFLPDNFHTLTRSDSKRAIEQLSDELHLCMNQSIVKRIDFSENFLMNHKPELYYKYLGDCQHYNRLTQEKSLYYSNKLRTKLFYNKIAEAKHRRLIIPEVWNNQNVLRYELRFISRLSNQFNLSEVKAEILSNERFYVSLFERWHSEYKAINKINSINFNFSKMNSPKDFMKQLQLYAIHNIGQDRIIAEIEHLRSSKKFEKPEYYSRLKKDIKDICSLPKLADSSELIAELDKKISDSKRHYR